MINTGEILARNARKYPQREALVYGEKRYTYSELDQAANRLADSFIGLSLKKGFKACLCLWKTLWKRRWSVKK